MEDVRVGMRLRNPLQEIIGVVTVTLVTDRGFQYDLDDVKPMIPRWGMIIAKCGHWHFGFNGEAIFEAAP